MFWIQSILKRIGTYHFDIDFKLNVAKKASKVAITMLLKKVISAIKLDRQNNGDLICCVLCYVFVP